MGLVPSDGAESWLADDVNRFPLPTAGEAVAIVTVELPAFGVLASLSFGLGDKADCQRDVLESVSALVLDLGDSLLQEQLRQLDLDSSRVTVERWRAEALETLTIWNSKLRDAEDARNKVASAKTRMNTMRDAYFKELLHLREQVFQKTTSEAEGKIFRPDNFCLFDPEDYCFDEDTARHVQAKLFKRIDSEATARVAEVTRGLEERAIAAERMLTSTSFLLERKELLLEKFVQKVNFKEVSSSERGALLEQESRHKKAATPTEETPKYGMLGCSGKRRGMISRTKSFLAGSMYRRSFLGRVAPDDGGDMSGPLAVFQVTPQTNTSDKRFKMTCASNANARSSSSLASDSADSHGARSMDLGMFQLGRSSARGDVPCALRTSLARLEQGTQSDVDGLWTEHAFDLMRKQQHFLAEESWSTLLAGHDPCAIGSGDVSCDNPVISETAARKSFATFADVACQTDADKGVGQDGPCRAFGRFTSEADEMSELELKRFLEHIGYAHILVELVQGGCGSLPELSAMEECDLRKTGFNLVSYEVLQLQLREWMQSRLGSVKREESSFEAQLSHHPTALIGIDFDEFTDAAGLDSFEHRLLRSQQLCASTAEVTCARPAGGAPIRNEPASPACSSTPASPARRTRFPVTGSVADIALKHGVSLEVPEPPDSPSAMASIKGGMTRSGLSRRRSLHTLKPTLLEDTRLAPVESSLSVIMFGTENPASPSASGGGTPQIRNLLKGPAPVRPSLSVITFGTEILARSPVSGGDAPRVRSWLRGRSGSTPRLCASSVSCR